MHSYQWINFRWQRDEKGDKVVNALSGNPVLEFVCIERGDGGGWAIPGGMVDPGKVFWSHIRNVILPNDA